MGNRRRFSREFKVEAVRMIAESGHSLAQVSRDLGVRPDMLRRWRRKLAKEGAGAFPGGGNLPPADEEVRRLRRELSEVREERDILKKAVAIFSGRRQ